MEWLNQNWAYLVLLAGVILLMRFGGMGCGFAGRRKHASHGASHLGNDAAIRESVPSIDPVSGRPVDPMSAVATIHRGRAVYFETRENRDRFEAAPDRFATGQEGPSEAESHRHGGCC